MMQTASPRRGRTTRSAQPIGGTDSITSILRDTTTSRSTRLSTIVGVPSTTSTTARLTQASGSRQAAATRRRTAVSGTTTIRNTRLSTTIGVSSTNSTTSPTVRLTQASGSRQAAATRRRTAVSVLPTVRERLSVVQPSPPRQNPAAGSRGRSARNVHVDKEVQTEERDEVAISLNLPRRRHRSLSPISLPCSICFNEMHPIVGTSIVSLRCGHVFCLHCIDKSYDENFRHCPLCMVPFQKRHFRRVYL